MIQGLTRHLAPWRGLVLGLAIGTLGGWLAHLAQLPLAWMIGAMCATTAASIAGLPLAMPSVLRAAMVAVLGVMLGSSFTPDLLERLGQWSISLSALIAYTAVAAVAGLVYFRLVSSYDRVTAFFSSMPGGLSEMIMVGSEMGGDGRVISLTHASRILLVVLTLPFAFQLLLDYEPAVQSAVGPSLGAIAPLDLGLLAACAVVGYVLARALRIPAAAVVGPMILSTAVHLSGMTAAAPPLELVAAAQVVVGTAIGCRFAGVPLGFVGRTVAVATGATVVLVGVTLAFSFALAAITGLSLPALVLAFSPGGLAEMSLIALALSMDAAFVATHHIIRIFIIVVFAPLAYRVLSAGFGRDRGAA